MFYFYLASLWGFAIGAAGLGVALALSGRTVIPDLPLVLMLLPFAGFALGGGAAASIAYREARRRRH